MIHVAHTSVQSILARTSFGQLDTLCCDHEGCGETATNVEQYRTPDDRALFRFYCDEHDDGKFATQGGSS